MAAIIASLKEENEALKKQLAAVILENYELKSGSKPSDSNRSDSIKAPAPGLAAVPVVKHPPFILIWPSNEPR